MKANELSIGWAMKQKDPVAALQRVINNIRTWADRPSETFTALCGTEGDRFTHGDVVRAHLYLVFVFAMMCVAGWLEGGAV